jgi:hypothetical protein
VEELLWLNGWKSPSEVRRGGTLPGAKGNVDWALKAAGYPVCLEAKFRPSDWPRNTDQGTFLPIGGSFLGKAAHKFPNPPREAVLHLVGITAFENITNEIAHLIGQELEATPQVHGVIFRTFAQMTHVLSLDADIEGKVFNLLTTAAAKDFPTNYFVPCHIQQRDQRVGQRAKAASGSSRRSKSRVFCRGNRPRIDSPILIPETDAYRMKVTRGADGEPRFQAIPKEIWAKKEEPGKPATLPTIR